MEQAMTELISVKQLPVIEEQLRKIKADVQSRVDLALSLVCTDETKQTVKAERAALNKEFAQLEARRKEVKASIMAPYEAFETLYRECVADLYRDADAKLKTRIDEVDIALKGEKLEKVEKYFIEYRESLGISADVVTFAHAGIKVTLSASDKSLREQAASFLDSIADDLATIETQEHPAEIMVEYRQDLNLSRAIYAVSMRHKAIAKEEERKHEAAQKQDAMANGAMLAEAAANAEPVVSAPIATDAPVEEAASNQMYTATFKVTATLEMLRDLKRFLTEGGYQYE